MSLETYYINESILIKEIEEDKLTYIEAKQRCDELWELIPDDVSLNPVRLSKTMKDKFSNDPHYDVYKRVFNIDISNIDEEYVDEYVKRLTNKFKQKKL